MPMFEALQQLFAATRVRREPIPFVICRLQPGTPLEPVVRLQPPPLCVTVEPDGATVFLPEPEPREPHGTSASDPVGPSSHSPRLAIVADPLSQQGTNLQADAPACDVCGSITVRSGTCYKCLNCGNSMGCS